MDPDTERITRPVLEHPLLTMLSLLNSPGSTVAKPHLNNSSLNASTLPDRKYMRQLLDQDLLIRKLPS